MENIIIRSMTPIQHRLKEVFKRARVPLWKLRNLTGVGEPKMSRYLNGIDKMPLKLEQELDIIADILVKQDKTISDERREFLLKRFNDIISK
jgi:hypothetical protein